MTETELGAFTLRRGRADDVDRVTNTLVADERTVRGSSDWGVADTANWWRGLDLQGESWVVDGADGVVAAVVGLSRRGDDFTAWISVGPGVRGLGLEEALVDHTERRTTALGGTQLDLLSFAEDLGATRVFESAGYSPVRRYYRMEIELHASPERPVWPIGIAASGFDLADAHAVHEAIQEGLADDWGFVPTPFADWKALRLESPDFDPALWCVAWDEEDVAGVIRCDPKRRGMGWVASLSVRRQWRRRGIGLALLRHAFRKFHDLGERRVGLGVDSENLSGATRLYERAGMHVAAETVTWRKDLP